MANKKTAQVKKNRILNKVSHFRQEMKKQTNTAIVTAFALIIGLSWQSTLKSIIDALLSKITTTDFSTLFKDTALYNIASSVLFTIVCVIGIVLITRKEEKDESKDEGRKSSK